MLLPPGLGLELGLEEPAQPKKDDASDDWEGSTSADGTDSAMTAMASDESLSSMPGSPRCEVCSPLETYEPGDLLRTEVRRATPPQVLNLADTIKEPVSVCPECPSVGSAGHYLGLCKPCDFIHRGSCRTGAACKFCHLCGPAENKQRKKEKRTAIRSIKRWQKSGMVAGLW